MANPSKKLQRRIPQFKYHCLKEYDLDGDRLNTDEFIYDSDISVEDKAPKLRFGKLLEKRDVMGGVKSDSVTGQRGAERVDPPTNMFPSKKDSRAALKISAPIALSDTGIPSDANVRLVPDPSVDGRKIEEAPENPIFLDGSPIAPSKYEAIFEPAQTE